MFFHHFIVTSWAYKFDGNQSARFTHQISLFNLMIDSKMCLIFTPVVQSEHLIPSLLHRKRQSSTQLCRSRFPPAAQKSIFPIDFNYKRHVQQDVKSCKQRGSWETHAPQNQEENTNTGLMYVWSEQFSLVWMGAIFASGADFFYINLRVKHWI